MCFFLSLAVLMDKTWMYHYRLNDSFQGGVNFFFLILRLKIQVHEEKNLC